MCGNHALGCLLIIFVILVVVPINICSLTDLCIHFLILGFFGLHLLAHLLRIVFQTFLGFLQGLFLCKLLSLALFKHLDLSLVAINGVFEVVDKLSVLIASHCVFKDFLKAVLYVSALAREASIAVKFFATIVCGSSYGLDKLSFLVVAVLIQIRLESKLKAVNLHF